MDPRRLLSSQPQQQQQSYPDICVAAIMSVNVCEAYHQNTVDNFLRAKLSYPGHIQFILAEVMTENMCHPFSDAMKRANLQFTHVVGGQSVELNEMPNIGQLRNMIVRACTAPFISFFDGDDFYGGQYLKFLAYKAAHPISPNATSFMLPHSLQLRVMPDGSIDFLPGFDHRDLVAFGIAGITKTAALVECPFLEVVAAEEHAAVTCFHKKYGKDAIDVSDHDYPRTLFTYLKTSHMTSTVYSVWPNADAKLLQSTLGFRWDHPSVVRALSLLALIEPPHCWNGTQIAGPVPLMATFLQRISQPLENRGAIVKLDVDHELLLQVKKKEMEQARQKAAELEQAAKAAQAKVQNLRDTVAKIQNKTAAM